MKEKQKAKTMQRFLWWCAGAKVHILQRFPNDWNEQSALGVFVLIVAIIAAASMTLVFAAVLELNKIISFLGGLFWGFVILSFDRVFLTFYRKNKITILRISSRLLTSIVFSLLITDTALLYVFRGDIKVQIVANNINEQKKQQQNVFSEPEKIEFESLTKDEASLQNRLDKLRLDMQEKMQIRDAEGRGDKTFQLQDGTVIELSGKESHAGEYENRDKEYEAAKAVFEKENDEIIGGTIAHNLKRTRDRLQTLRTKSDNIVGTLITEQATNRLLEMHHALFEILFNGKNLGATLFFILLWVGLILLESTPILTKFTSGISRYDLALMREDQTVSGEKKYIDTQFKLVETIYENIEKNEDLTDYEEKLKELMVKSHLDSIIRQEFDDRNSPELGEIISIFIANKPEISPIILDFSPELINTMRFDDLLDNKINTISKEIQAVEGKVELVKVTDSTGNEIDREFVPLIPQLNEDRILILHYSPSDSNENVTK